MDSAATDADARHGGDVTELPVTGKNRSQALDRVDGLVSWRMGHPLWVVRGAWLGVCLCVFVPAQVRADGPHIAFHDTQGAYTVTLFTAPDPLVTGPAAFTLLVQQAGDGSLASVVRATGELKLQGAAAIPFVLSTSGSGDGQLPAVTVPIHMPGNYALKLLVAANGALPARFTGTLPVEANHGKRNTVLWAVLVLVAFVLLFLVNQHAKQQQRRPGPGAAV